MHPKVLEPKAKSRGAKDKSNVKGTGKGKATVWDSTDDSEYGDGGGEDKYDDDEEDAYLTSHDFEDDPVPAKHGVNGAHVVDGGHGRS